MAYGRYDCALIDLEHGPGSYLDAIAMMQALKGSGCVPLARVPSNDAVAIKRILDAGVAGVMVPGGDTAEQARAAVSACRYPPQGRRGTAATIVRASGYGRDVAAYQAKINDALLVICQIESRQAVENVEEIAAVEGLDLRVIGPMDLAADLGHLGEPDAPAVRDCITRVEQAAKAAGKLIGSIGTPARPAPALLEAGYHLVIGDADSQLLRLAADASLARIAAAKTARRKG